LRSEDRQAPGKARLVQRLALSLIGVGMILAGIGLVLDLISLRILVMALHADRAIGPVVTVRHLLGHGAAQVAEAACAVAGLVMLRWIALRSRRP
jgi:hypothetical protein